MSFGEVDEEQTNVHAN